MNLGLNRCHATLVLLLFSQTASSLEISYQGKTYKSTQEEHAERQEDGTIKTMPYRFDRNNAYFKETVYSPGREDLHKNIIEQLTRRVKKSSAPQIIFTAGIPGSGKSTTLQSLEDSGLIEKDKFVLIDQDLIKSMLPEAKAFGILAKALHKEGRPENVNDLVTAEATDIAVKLFAKALDQGYPIIYDGTFRDEFVVKQLIKIAQAHKYRPSIVKVETDKDVAWERTISRGLQEGRFVPKGYFDSTEPRVTRSVSNVSRAFLKFGLDSYVIDNSETPKITGCQTQAAELYKLDISLGHKLEETEIQEVLDHCGGNLFSSVAHSAPNNRRLKRSTSVDSSNRDNRINSERRFKRTPHLNSTPSDGQDDMDLHTTPNAAPAK